MNKKHEQEILLMYGRAFTCPHCELVFSSPALFELPKRNFKWWVLISFCLTFLSGAIFFNINEENLVTNFKSRKC